MKSQPIIITRPDKTQRDRAHSVHNFVRAYENGRLSSILEKFKARAALSKSPIYWEGSEEQIEFDRVKRGLEIDAAIMLGHWDLVYRVVNQNHYKSKMMYFRHQLYWWARYGNDNKFTVVGNKLVSPSLDVHGNRAEYIKAELSPEDIELLTNSTANPSIRKWLGVSEIIPVRRTKKWDDSVINEAKKAALTEAIEKNRNKSYR